MTPGGLFICPFDGCFACRDGKLREQFAELQLKNPAYSVRAFARNAAVLELPILLWDERWSTQAVERAMIDADVSRAKRAEKVDALAAAHILQGAIDALANLQGPQ